MNLNKIYALSLRHIFLIKGSFPRILDLIYWPTIQIFLWGFISKFFTLSSSYYENTVGVILSAAILYDFLFRSSISYNMMFLEEIWSRNFTNLFIAPIKISEIIAALTFTAIFRTLIGLIPAALLAIPFFGVSIFKIGLPLIFLLVSLYIFGVTLGLLVTYRSPLMSSYFFPEAEVLSSLSYFRLCLWGDSLKLIDQYYNVYRPHSDALKAILLKNKRSYTYFLKLLLAPIKENEDMNPFVRNLMTQMKSGVSWKKGLSRRKKN